MSTARILTEPEIRELVDIPAARASVRDAFIALSRGDAVLPDVLHVDFVSRRGETHVKGAWLGDEADLWAVKVASGFYDNPSKGLPVASGLSMVFSARTGEPHTILLDNGWLTELRTGAAGALAAELLANESIERLAMIGYGGQAGYQLEALLDVRTPETAAVWGPDREKAERFAAGAQQTHGLPFEVAPSAEEAVRGADLVVTTTPARSPIIKADWIAPGTHITAIGSDLPVKQELEVGVVGQADLVVADSIRQARLQGEIHHALDHGVIAEDRIVELGALASGDRRGRTAPSDVTVADLTGLGVQDAALATLVAAQGDTQGLGQQLAT